MSAAAAVAAAQQRAATGKKNKNSVHKVRPHDEPWDPAQGNTDGSAASRKVRRQNTLSKIQQQTSRARMTSVFGSNGACTKSREEVVAQESAESARASEVHRRLEVEKERNALKYQAKGRVIDPRTTKWMQWWDIIMMLALLFTAMVTPLEVAFLEGGTVRRARQ